MYYIDFSYLFQRIVIHIYNFLSMLIMLNWIELKWSGLRRVLEGEYFLLKLFKGRKRSFKYLYSCTFLIHIITCLPCFVALNGTNHFLPNCPCSPWHRQRPHCLEVDKTHLAACMCAHTHTNKCKRYEASQHCFAIVLLQAWGLDADVKCNKTFYVPYVFA